MPPSRSTGAIFVLPTTTEGQQGPVAGWISTSGWAAAAERVLGRAWVVTPGGVVDIDGVRARAARVSSGAVRSRGVRRWIPTIAKTAVKDAREWRRARQFHVDPDGPWSGSELEFVWQRHELFHTSGVDLARALGVPVVLFVPAVLVWQAQQWSVRRPGWGSWLERTGEQPALRAASLVACGTDIVADEVIRLGVDPARVLVTPTGTDPSLFGHTDPTSARARLGIGDRFVIGWVGSFRSFHTVEQLIAAAPSTPDTAVLLVGDGPERQRIEHLAREAGITAIFTGTVPHPELPEYLAAMDVGVVLASASRPFHYSPLKVAEYLAAGVPVVAPDVPALAQRLEPDRDSVLYPPEDVARLRSVFAELASDRARLARLHVGALAAGAAWSWDEQIRRVRVAIGTDDAVGTIRQVPEG